MVTSTDDLKARIEAPIDSISVDVLYITNGTYIECFELCFLRKSDFVCLICWIRSILNPLYSHATTIWYINKNVFFLGEDEGQPVSQLFIQLM